MKEKRRSNGVSKIAPKTEMDRGTQVRNVKGGGEGRYGESSSILVMTS